MNLNQFRLLRVVGKGAFGKVRIVEKKDTGLTFALKYIRKEEGKPLRPGCPSPPVSQLMVFLVPQWFVRKVYGISFANAAC